MFLQLLLKFFQSTFSVLFPSQSEMSDPNTQSFDTMFQPSEAPEQMSTQTRDHGYGFNQEPPAQIKKIDDFSSPGITQRTIV